MAWRGFNSSSVQRLSESTQFTNINIESNRSIEVHKIMYEKFQSVYKCAVPPKSYLNPACISFYCRIYVIKTLSTSCISADKCYSLVDGKLIHEVCKDLVPLIQTFNPEQRKTLYLLANDVCSTEPTDFFKTTKSYFDQFLKVYDTRIPDRSFFDGLENTLPAKVYGIGYDSTYTPLIGQFVRNDGSLNDAILLSLRNSSLPISFETSNVINHLMNFGEASQILLNHWQLDNHPQPESLPNHLRNLTPLSAQLALANLPYLELAVQEVWGGRCFKHGRLLVLYQ